MVEERIADYAVGSPARLALNVLAHKWTLLIVLALKAGAMRFSDLPRRVPGVTPQVLSDSLRELSATESCVEGISAKFRRAWSTA